MLPVVSYEQETDWNHSTWEVGTRQRRKRARESMSKLMLKEEKATKPNEYLAWNQNRHLHRRSIYIEHVVPDSIYRRSRPHSHSHITAAVSFYQIPTTRLLSIPNLSAPLCATSGSNPNQNKQSYSLLFFCLRLAWFSFLILCFSFAPRFH